MARNKVIYLLIISIFIFLSFPNKSKAEIATVKDWIGVFPFGSNDYSKAGTIPNCKGLDLADPLTPAKPCWFYANSCNQTFGSTPQLNNSCTFTLDPIPANGSYVFRLMAYDGATVDDLIAYKTAVYNGTSTLPPPITANGKLYNIKGDLTINNDITVNETGVIFVDGNLYINTNLLAYPSNGTAPDPKKGIVFVVKGTIYIDRNVDTINAFLVSHGRVFSYVDDSDKNIDCPTRLTNGYDITPFCSAYDKTVLPAACADFSEASKSGRLRLAIQGSAISLNSCIRPSFTRQFAIPGATIAPTPIPQPAEVINFEPKYLVIMKDIFSRDLKIWREVQ